MAIVKILLAIAILATSARCDNDALPKPSYTRTLLKVARSYPGETEELKVRTSQGNLATLIVKRRNKSSPFADASPSNYNYSPSTTVPVREDNGPDTIPAISFKNVEVDPWKRRKIPNSADSRNSAEKYSFHQDTKSWIPINNNQDASTTERYFNWKPVQTYENVPASSDVAYRTFGEVGTTTDESPVRWSFTPNQRLRTNIGANTMKNRGSKNVPPEVSVRSEINVKGSSQSTQRTPMLLTANRSVEIQGKRVPDDPIDKYQVWRNAKVINNQLVMDNGPTTQESRVPEGSPEQKRSFERFIEDVNRRYGQNQGDESRKFSAHDVLRSEVYDTARDTYRPNIRKRMLQPEIAAIYPNSRLYTPESHKTVPMTLKSGVRAPVLQYAHPELGVQPAKVVKNEKRRPVDYPETFSFPEQRHKKKYVLNDKNLVDSYTVKNYYPNQHFYGLKRPIETPFWIKISENLKNQFTEGVAKVSEMTKPVIDPLVEATRKISQNLGLSRREDVAQDKIGSVATGSSALIPALGLVASGAALGIGAIAVGRYLDVDVLKRSNDGDDAEIENTRALHSLSSYPGVQQRPGEISVSQNPSNDIYVLVDDQRRNAQNVKRRRRSLDFVDDLESVDTVPSTSTQRKGADLIAEIVEIDVPSSLQQAKHVKGQEINDIDVENTARRIVDEVISALGRRPSDIEKSDEEYVRRRRNLQDSDEEVYNEFQNLENANVAELEHIPGDWTNTPCAKRIFCEAMIKKGSEAAIFMEKKMDNILPLIQRAAVDQVAIHLDQVMDAVRRHDCSVFSCSQQRSTQVFY